MQSFHELRSAAIPQTPESVTEPREWVPWARREAMEGGSHGDEKKNHISLAKNETGAQVVNITSNYLPK